MRDDKTLLELVGISDALRAALREAYELAQAGETGEPLREALHFARDLLDIANELLECDPRAGEHARGLALHMAEQIAAVGGDHGRVGDPQSRRRRLVQSLALTA